MGERVYSAEEATALLSDLRERLARIRDAREVVIRHAAAVRAAVAADGGGVAGDPASFEASRTLREELAHLADEDIVLRDPEAGLVDFPGEVEGRPIWLCWRLGEERVAFWHEIDAGFAGRRPL